MMFAIRHAIERCFELSKAQVVLFSTRFFVVILMTGKSSDFDGASLNAWRKKIGCLSWTCALHAQPTLSLAIMSPAGLNKLRHTKSLVRLKITHLGVFE